MITLPFKNPSHDADELVSVIDGSIKPSRIFSIEVIVDEEIRKFITENYFTQTYYPPTSIDLNKLDSGLKYKNLGDYPAANDRYYKSYVSFFHGMGYSIVPDHDFIINLEGFNTVYKKRIL